MPKRLALAALLAVAAPAAAHAQAAPARDNIDALIELHARAYKVPAAFVHKVVKRESNYNPRAKGGSALGLMQIKHATARGMGYSGDASGLYDPDTNLKYGIAYLAGAYRAAQGNIDQAYGYYRRGYYYAAKKLGITTNVAEAPAPAPAAVSSMGFASLFGLRTGPAVQTASADPGSALAYAGGAPTQVAAIEVPLPPQRPASFGGAGEAAPAEAVSQVVAVAAAAAQASSQAVAASSNAVEVPLPPRRPAATMLAAVGRPAAARRAAPEPVMEATAAPGQ